MNDYKHWGIPQSGTWGAMTAPVGARTDALVQNVREGVATFLNLVTPPSWEFVAPAPARMEARARGR
jgi:hypothetical protein